MKSKIRNPKKMRQLIDFKGLELEGGIYPTDIDGLIELRNREYIILEVKHRGAAVPYGQRLAIERMVDDFTLQSKGNLLWQGTYMETAGRLHQCTAGHRLFLPVRNT